jgi:RNA polymerase sigma-70 factor (ECF subfamily)
MTEGLSLVLSNAPTSAAEVDLAALVETHASLLFRVAHSILRNASEAEDTVQDVFLRVLQHQQSLPTIRDLRPWLVRIAWNLALDRRRRVRPDQMDAVFAQTLVAATLPADRSLAEAQRLTAVLHCLDHLPKKERQVLLLAALEELSTAEIAAITARSESAVRALLFRARTHLRTRLQKAGHA